jgi:hypothetical protein
MAKKTIKQLEEELAAAEAKIAELEKEPDEKADVEVVPKEEFDKLQEAFRKQEQELDDLVSQHEVSRETAEKLKNAIDDLKEPKALLFRKLSLALAEVKRIPKSGWNAHFKYKFAQEGDILDGIRPILADVGLALWTSIAEQKREVIEVFYKGKSSGMKTFTRVKMIFTVACADTGETITSEFWGEGEDEADKGLYKAYTGATKYFLTKNFLISSGDILQDNEPSDPEADTQYQKDYDDSRRNFNKQQNQRPNQNQGQNPKNDDTAPNTGEGSGIQPSKGELLAKFMILGGKEAEKEFEPFYTKQVKKGVTHRRMADFLDEEIQKRKETGGLPEQNEQPQQGQQQEPPSEGTAVDDMTPEEYVAYVESKLPFPLTPQEKEQILNDSKQGKRDH